MSVTEYWFVWAIPLSDIDRADALGGKGFVNFVLIHDQDQIKGKHIVSTIHDIITIQGLN